MDRKLLIPLIIAGGLVAFIGYFAALSGWMHDYSNGIYSHNLTEAVLETAGLLIYTYLGIRFFNRHVSSSR